VVMTRQPKIERKIEYLDFPLRGGEIKEFNDQKGTIGGYANYKHNLDFSDDITRDGAFRKTIQDAYSRKASQGLDYLYPYLWSHDWNQIPPGGVYDADEDRKGFYTRTQFNLDLQSGRDLYSSFKNRTLSKQSIGFKCINSTFEKDAATGKTYRNLLEVAVMEISAVVFPANDLAQVDTVKQREMILSSRSWPGYSAEREKGNASMSGSRKDTFAERYASAQLNDWQWDDWSDVGSSLYAAIMDCFSSNDPQAALESDVIPDLLTALRQYVSTGIDLGYQGSSSSSSSVGYMSLAEVLETKRGYINAPDHVKLDMAHANIMKYTKIAQSISKSVGSSPAARRYNESISQPLYNSRPMDYFEQKEAEQEEAEDYTVLLKTLTMELSLANEMRENRKAMESSMSPIDVAAARLRKDE